MCAHVCVREKERTITYYTLWQENQTMCRLFVLVMLFIMINLFHMMNVMRNNEIYK